MNEKMKTIDIKGRPYVTVNERIKAFRNNYKDYALISEIVELGDTHCVMKASVIDPQGRVVATGFARETVSKSPINKFAFLENCESSCWGRALGNFGIGVDDAICSADEILVKMSQETTQIELPLEQEHALWIENSASKEELLKVIDKIKKEQGKEHPKYRKSLINAYNKRLSELG